MHRISVVAFDGGGHSQEDAAVAVAHVGKRWSNSLKEQLAWSSAAAAAEPADMLPRWSCRLESGQAVEHFCERMTSLHSAQLVQVPRENHVTYARLTS